MCFFSAARFLVIESTGSTRQGGALAKEMEVEFAFCSEILESPETG
jgi:hypothetical protein